MNGLSWAARILVAGVFFGAGGAKLAFPKDRLRASMSWVEDYSQGTVRLIGALENVARGPKLVGFVRGRRRSNPCLRPASTSALSKATSLSQRARPLRPTNDDPQDGEAGEPWREGMRKTAVYGTAMAMLLMAVNLLHATSHVGQDVLSLQAWQWAYVPGVIYLAPQVAALLLWTPHRLAGAWLLLASMAGSFAFDFAYHFLIPGPDNVFTLQPGAWLAPFWVSVVLLVAVSGFGTLVGGWAVLRLSRSRARAQSAVGPEEPRRAS